MDIDGAPGVAFEAGVEEVEQLLKQPVTVDFVALGNNNLAIFKVPKGWKIGKFECKTGYWMMMLGPIELHKQ